MSITVNDVIESVRDRHVGFDSQKVGTAPVLRFLSDYQRTLFGTALGVNKHYGATLLEITLALADFDAGVALPSMLHPLGATLTWTLNNVTRTRPVRITQYEDRLTPRRFPCCYILRDTLYLMGTEAQWPNPGTIDFIYTAVPTDLTTLASSFALKDDARSCCVEAAAMFLAQRSGIFPEPQQLQPFATALKKAETTFLQVLAGALAPEQTT